MAKRTTKGNDRRSRYTRQVIDEAFADLLQQKPVEQITVTEICQRAEINRGTFYLHYDNPLDLLHKIEDATYEQMVEYSHQSVANESKRLTLTEAMMEMLQTDKVLRSMSPRLYQKICVYCEQLLTGLYEEAGNMEPWQAEVFATFIVNGCLAVNTRRQSKGYSNYKEEDAFVNKMIQTLHASLGISAQEVNMAFAQKSE